MARDVYNITAPFRFNGKILLIGRVEKRDTEFSEIVIFEKAIPTNGRPVSLIPHFKACRIRA